jgi:4,5-DOPA dioxygenase extradiol
VRRRYLDRMRMPVAFVSHGAPTLALDREVRGAELAAWGRALPRPRAIVVVSAHWLARGPFTGVEATAPLLHDFSGFPAALERITYAAPGAPEIAARVRALTGARAEPARPWDHGVWVPLLHMFPAADVPIVELALTMRVGPDGWLALGRALAPLRDEGVLVLGSGGVVHNLGRLAWDGGPTEAWASDFDAWIVRALDAGRLDDVADAVARAPTGRVAHPGYDHFAPLVVAAGAAAGDGALGAVRYPLTGFDLGNLGMRAIEFT